MATVGLVLIFLGIILLAAVAHLKEQEDREMELGAPVSEKKSPAAIVPDGNDGTHKTEQLTLISMLIYMPLSVLCAVVLRFSRRGERER